MPVSGRVNYVFVKASTLTDFWLSEEALKEASIEIEKYKALINKPIAPPLAPPSLLDSIRNPKELKKLYQINQSL